MIKIPQNRHFKPQGSWCLDFDGTADGRGAVPAHASISNIWNTGGYCSLWVNLHSIPSSEYPRFLSKHFWWINVGSVSGGNCYFYFRAGRSTTSGNWSTSTRTFPLGEWVFVEVYYDASSTSNVPTIWLNRTAQTLSVVTSPAGNINNDSSYILHMTAQGTGNADCNMSNIVLAKRNLFNMDLRYKRLTGREPDLCAYWPFWDGAGAVARDISNNANDASLETGATWERG